METTAWKELLTILFYLFLFILYIHIPVVTGPKKSQKKNNIHTKEITTETVLNSKVNLIYFSVQNSLSSYFYFKFYFFFRKFRPLVIISIELFIFEPTSK